MPLMVLMPAMILGLSAALGVALAVLHSLTPPPVRSSQASKEVPALWVGDPDW
jgi:hypothetical protein